MQRKFIYALICILCVNLLLVESACSKRSESDTEKNAEIQTEEETEWVPEFESLFLARKACLEAMDLTFPFSCYTDETVTPYREYVSEVNKIVSDDSTTQEEMEKLYHEILEKKASLDFKQGEVARVYIYSNTAEPWQYSPCKIAVIPAEWDKYSVVCYDDCQIKIRGNSTAGAPKKPYTFKLPEKARLLGMDKGSRWTLLAGMFDKTLMRTQIGFHLAEDLSCPYSSQTTLVEVYYNGEYQGVYDLIEPITDGKGQVDIDKDDNDFIIEIDVNRNDPQYYFTTGMGLRFKVEQPEDMSDERIAEMKSFFKEMEAAISSGDMSQYEKYIDVDSFVNVYLVMEYTKNLDSNSFSTRFFRKDGILYAGPVWDFDLSSGNVSDKCDEEGYRIYLNIRGRGDGSGDSTRGLWYQNGWFYELFKDPEFVSKVKERYAEVHDILENVYCDNNLGKSQIGGMLETYGDAFKRNYDDTDWDITRQYSSYESTKVMTFDEHVETLTQWFAGRLEYLDSVYLDSAE
jgi:spore coat protein CotH